MPSILEELQQALSFGPKITFKPAENAPSIYADPSAWADYRQQQAADKSFQNRPTPQQIEQAIASPTSNATEVDKQAESNLMALAIDSLLTPDPLATIGAGRGSVNPAPVDPSAPAPSTVQGQDRIDRSFPVAFQKSPPTGKVNTEGGVDRVNARTSEHGVTATVGANGKIFMTNVNPDGTVNKGTGSPNSVLGNGMGTRTSGNVNAPNLPLALSSTMQKLAKSTDPNEARGFMESIVQGIALAQAKLNEEALQFGSQKVGLTELENQLSQAMMADRNDPNWYPGIGDSPITAAIRVQISQQKTAARSVAEDYLNTNTNQAALKAFADSAQKEYARIAKIQDAGVMLDLRQRENQQQKRWLKEEQASEVAQNLTPQERTRIATLAPQTQGDPVQMGEWFIQRSKSSKGVLDQVLAAEGDDLVVFALEDNADAVKLVAANEGKTTDEIKERLKKIRRNAESLDFDEKRIKFQTSNLSPEERTATQQSLRRASMDKKVSGDKKEIAKQNLKWALDMERAGQTTAVIENVENIWKDPTGPMGPAIAQAKKVTGNASLDSVLTAYIGTSSGPEAIQKMSTFKALLQKTVEAYPPSFFGVPDINQLNAAVVESSRSIAQSRIGNTFSRPFSIN